MNEELNLNPLENDPSHQDRSEPVPIDLGTARARFQRTGPSSASLELEYEVGVLKTHLHNQNLQQGVERLCEIEIATMREAFAKVGAGLMHQLEDDGKDIALTRSYHDRDQRSWSDKRNTFAVDPAIYSSKEKITVRREVSDARIVQAAVSLAIHQREESIRKLYGKILSDAQAKRDKNQIQQAASNTQSPLLAATDLDPDLDRRLDPIERMLYNYLDKMQGSIAYVGHLRRILAYENSSFAALSERKQESLILTKMITLRGMTGSNRSQKGIEYIADEKDISMPIAFIGYRLVEKNNPPPEKEIAESSDETETS